MDRLPKEDTDRLPLAPTRALGRKALLAPDPIELGAGGSCCFPFPGRGAVKIRAGQGKERVTIFAAAAALEAGVCGGRIVGAQVTGSGPARQPLDRRPPDAWSRLSRYWVIRALNSPSVPGAIMYQNLSRTRLE
jgi:hypothetical protein